MKLKHILLFIAGGLWPLTLLAATNNTVLSGAQYPTTATVSPLGELRVENPASQVFLDTFSTSTLDTINRWVATAGGTGVAPTNALGATTLNGGTTLNSFSKLSSLLANGVGVFAPSEPGFLLFNTRANLSATLNTGLIDFGFGTSSATPTIAAPIIQCVCFEVTTAGKLQAVTYQTGVRVLIQDLSVLNPFSNTVPQPAAGDTTAHKYFIYFRGDVAYWSIDNPDNVVAQYQTGASGPDVNNLPLLSQVISNAGTAETLQLNAVSIGDTSHTGTTQNLFNGFTFEPTKSNTDCNSSVLTLTAQGSGTVNSLDQINTNGRGVTLTINSTTVTAGSYTVAIQGKDLPSGTYYTIGPTAAAGAITGAIAAAGFQFMTAYPGATVQASSATLGPIISYPLPRTWRVQAVVTTGPVTATIGCSVIN